MKNNLKKIILYIFVISVFNSFLTIKTTVSLADSDVNLTDKKSDLNSKDITDLNDKNFWISKIKNPDKILISTKKLLKLSKQISKNPETNVIDLDSYPKVLSKQELESEINRYKKPDEPRYIGESKLDDIYYKNLFENRNLSNLKERNDVRYGFIINNTHVFSFPTQDVSYDAPNMISFNLNCETGLKVWERVLILHVSSDNKFYFIRSYNYSGWVSVNDVALADQNSWKKYGNYNDFLIVSGNSFELDCNLFNKETSHKRLTMGTKLPLIKRNKPAEIDNVSTISSYVVMLPTCDKQGRLKVLLARVPLNRDVNVGYLDYTPRNIINQAFKMLGNLYGWSDLWESRDCSSFIADIYKTFGLFLPRNANLQSSTKFSVDISQMDLKEKKEFIMRQPIGSSLFCPGHIMLYIGNHNNEPYIIHAAYSYLDSQYNEILSNCVIISNLNIMRQSVKKTFLEAITKINIFK